MKITARSSLARRRLVWQVLPFCMVSEMGALIQHGGDTIRSCASWWLAMCGGEAFTLQLEDPFAGLGLESLTILNPYGPTEETIIATVGEVDYRGVAATGGGNISVGQAIPGYAVYIVDKKNQAVTPGFPGQVALAGPSVASGYLRQPELMKAKFISDTVSPPSDKSVWGWLYLTGDKGRMMQDGSFQILGCTDGDNQVKIRGIRIELPETSSALVKASAGAIVDSAVVVRGTGPGQFLVAFVVFASGYPLQKSLGQERGDHQVQDYLGQMIQALPLPMYMRPALAVPIVSLPVTGRGKLDTKVLQALALPQISGAVDTGANEVLNKTERQLKESSTLGDLAAHISNKTTPTLTSTTENKHEYTHKQAIDWEEETPCPGHTVPSERSQTNQSRCHHHHQTQRLHHRRTNRRNRLPRQWYTPAPRLQSPRLTHSLRRHSQQPATLSLSPPTIIPHAGDLSLSLLDMSNLEAAAVLAETDIIIHNGATVSHLQNYGSLRGPNVASTQELVRMALIFGNNKNENGYKTPIPIHFISKGGVAHLSGLAE
ncbi:uncharacterized protein BCR38DRAFT_470691 [Pseudomassariella vexata]|uniref:AMP-dependent synthetase/ligase domain-containing protein n=1 Tax=Pseudomassariella vexata TaxID=1141098 RepID=A0A1Y2EJU3_9PEZI|nr:uncharacterized protein BCR38DRAFT_470691 [Pseudomassariella vexata]ORY71821.1 hypothetical protein BCR38DRAFT_470691 [Pseudomassariella vexata]